MKRRSTVFQSEEFVTALVNGLTDILKELIKAHYDRGRVAKTQ